MKKFYVAGICALLLLTVTGCGNQIPEMTEEQYAMVTEYAANKLLQYSSAYHSRLVDTSVPPEPTPTPRPTPAPVQPEDADQEQIAESGSSEGGVNEAQAEPAPMLPIAQVLGLDGLSVDYTGYRLCDSYPDTDASPENMFFAMTASAGSKLLILNMEITNLSAETVVVDTLSVSAKYRVLLNGQNAKNVHVTMLEDDFTAIQKEIAAGETAYAVVVAEISDEEAESLASVGLEVKAGEQKTVVTQ